MYDLTNYDKFIIVFWERDNPIQRLILDDDDNRFKMFYTIDEARQRIEHLEDPDYIHAIYDPRASAEGEEIALERLEHGYWGQNHEMNFLEIHRPEYSGLKEE